jgi:hypothetical protein
MQDGSGTRASDQLPLDGAANAGPRAEMDRRSMVRRPLCITICLALFHTSSLL